VSRHSIRRQVSSSAKYWSGSSSGTASSWRRRHQGPGSPERQRTTSSARPASSARLRGARDSSRSTGSVCPSGASAAPGVHGDASAARRRRWRTPAGPTKLHTISADALHLPRPRLDDLRFATNGPGA